MGIVKGGLVKSQDFTHCPAEPLSSSVSGESKLEPPSSSNKECFPNLGVSGDQVGNLGF